MQTTTDPTIAPIALGPFTLESRLIVGTGKYETFELMRDALDAAVATWF